MDSLGLPFVLLAALWGALNVVLKALEMMTERRDLFQGFAAKISRTEDIDASTARQIFLDWLPLWLGTTTFLFIFSVLIWSLPLWVPDKFSPPTSRPLLLWVVRGAAAVPFFGFVSFVLGGAMDVFVLTQKQRLRRAREEAANKAVDPTPVREPRNAGGSSEG